MQGLMKIYTYCRLNGLAKGLFRLNHKAQVQLFGILKRLNQPQGLKTCHPCVPLHKHIKTLLAVLYVFGPQRQTITAKDQRSLFFGRCQAIQTLPLTVRLYAPHLMPFNRKR